ncbi:MAG TPA: imidazole glycerol phosphate synthase subunit HisF [Spirochaetia bacterium]|nr:imidazole glycerol phosphate synthase subunit HisF [Spirochaetales bacterium]HRS66094.1 imidazole glycerol phosphate synthase subunit HisF [Spirochaetia bacterium]HOT59884.1 imidazole glycerol phosphate synthase subunit HisF [Spirochaetales bacterium]HPD79881.1 imidazole glycerol phosphate synthase subunit HisF [Spirochaetales bacterium]HQK33264.1 imidazole glycerol phosphate synthase subunit HisF [Spirochaetales bacterium]
MTAKRIIPCLDIANGTVVKGNQYRALTPIGDPLKLVRRYEQDGADEIILLDILATPDAQTPMTDLIRLLTPSTFIPICVGGGIRSLDDVHALMDAGTDKVAICSAALENPALITTIAKQYGSQCVVVSIDAKQDTTRKTWLCFSHGGRTNTGIDVLTWAQEAEARGAGEILLNSIDADGTGKGYDIKLLKAVSTRVHIPVIASSGAGTLAHIRDAFSVGHADAVLIAGMLHRRETTIQAIKQFLLEEGVTVRC